MAHRSSPVGWPLEWQPLVSAREWAVLERGFQDAPEVLSDLRAVLADVSPRVRRVLLGNLMQTMRSGERPLVALWTALALTGHDLKMRSAVALGQHDAREDHQRAGTVTPLPRPTKS